MAKIVLEETTILMEGTRFEIITLLTASAIEIVQNIKGDGISNEEALERFCDMLRTAQSC